MRLQEGWGILSTRKGVDPYSKRNVGEQPNHNSHLHTLPTRNGSEMGPPASILISHVRKYDTSVYLELRTVFPEHSRFRFTKEKEGQQIEEYPGDDTLQQCRSRGSRRNLG